MVLVVAAWTEDISIDGDIGFADAEVVSDDFSRTLVRFYTPDGAEHIPQVGVLYPSGLKVGDVRRGRVPPGQPGAGARWPAAAPSSRCCRSG